LVCGLQFVSASYQVERLRLPEASAMPLLQLPANVELRFVGRKVCHVESLGLCTFYSWMPIPIRKTIRISVWIILASMLALFGYQKHDCTGKSAVANASSCTVVDISSGTPRTPLALLHIPQHFLFFLEFLLICC